MTKTKAIGWAVFFGVLIIVCLTTQLYGCILPFLITALVFALIACFKHKRDLRIITETYQEERAARREVSVVPPMTSKGSNGRLFVPPPLQ
jgi:uncharacterized membrane protein